MDKRKSVSVDRFFILGYYLASYLTIYSVIVKPQEGARNDIKSIEESFHHEKQTDHQGEN